MQSKIERTSRQKFQQFMKIMKYQPDQSQFKQTEMLKWGLLIVGRTRAGKSMLYELLQHNQLKVTLPLYNLESPRQNNKTAIRKSLDSFTREPNIYYDKRFGIFVIDCPGVKDGDIQCRVENSFYIHQVANKLDYIRICMMASLPTGKVQKHQFMIFKQVWKMFPKSSLYFTIIINCVGELHDSQVIKNFRQSLQGHFKDYQGGQELDSFQKLILQTKPYILRHGRHMRSKSQQYSIERSIVQQLLTKDNRKYQPKQDFKIAHANLSDGSYDSQQKFESLVGFYRGYIQIAFRLINQNIEQINQGKFIPISIQSNENNTNIDLLEQACKLFQVFIVINNGLLSIQKLQITSSEKVLELKNHLVVVLKEIAKLRKDREKQISFGEVEQIENILDSLQFLFSMFQDTQNSRIESISKLLKELKESFFGFVHTHFKDNLGLANIVPGVAGLFQACYKSITDMNKLWKYHNSTSPLITRLTLQHLQIIKAIYKKLRRLDPQIKNSCKASFKKAIEQAQIIVQNYWLLHRKQDLSLFIQKAEALQKKITRYQHLKPVIFYTELLVRLSDAYLKVLKSPFLLKKHTNALQNCLQIYKDLKYYNQIEKLLMDKDIVELSKKHFELFIQTGEYFEKEGVDNRMTWRMYVRARQCNRNLPSVEKQEQVQKKLKGLRINEPDPL